MKELASQPKPKILPFQLDLALTVASHAANGKLDKLDPNASSLLNNILAPAVELEFPNEEEANRTVVELVRSTLDVFWRKSSTENVKEQQLIDRLRLLRNQGISRAEITERLNLHFRWRLNSQKI